MSAETTRLLRSIRRWVLFVGVVTGGRRRDDAAEESA